MGSSIDLTRRKSNVCSHCLHWANTETFLDPTKQDVLQQLCAQESLGLTDAELQEAALVSPSSLINKAFSIEISQLGTTVTEYIHYFSQYIYM